MRLFLLLQFLFSALFFGQDADLVAFYPFNGTADDASGNGHHGTIYGASSTSDRFGNANSAIFFDGENDYLNLATVPKIQKYQSFTLSIWLKMAAANDYAVLYGEDHGSHTYDALRIVVADDELSLGIYNAGWSYSRSQTYQFEPGRDYFITLRKNDTAVDYFVNGVNIGTAQNLAHSISNRNATGGWIGRARHGSLADSYFHGNLDDLRIYNYALLESQIDSLYHLDGWDQSAGAPLVSNVHFSQRTDGSFLVDIRYDLYDADGDEMTVSLAVSGDGGATWEIAATTLSGDVGAGITSGTGKTIVWDFAADHPNTSGAQYQFKVIADDGRGGGGETGTMTDIDGNVYQTIKIGNQWWMAENLKVTHYRNGDAIPNVTSDSQWENFSSGAYCAYDNDNDHVATYGLLYNWYAVDDSRNIAPEGWHVPTDAEWKALEMHLGMSQSEADDTGTRGTDEGGKLKETGTTHWNSPNTGATNSSGFTALPGGKRGNRATSGRFAGFGDYAIYWTATIYQGTWTYAWYRVLPYDKSEVFRTNLSRELGFSVRLVKDAE